MNNELQKSQPEMNKLTAEQLSRLPRIEPGVDIYENADEILVLADLPGVQPGDLSVSLDGDLLKLEGHKRQVDDQEGKSLARLYTRAFRVPRTVDPAAVKAELDGGVLTLHLGKKAVSKPRQIEINVS